MENPRARRLLTGLLAAVWLALPPGRASGAGLSLRSGVPAAPPVLPAPLTAAASVRFAPSLAPALSPAAPALAAQPLVQAAPAVVSPVVAPQAAPLPAAPGSIEGYASFVRSFAHSQSHGTAEDAEKLKALFDGARKTAAPVASEASALRESRPGYQPHESVPRAVLPGGRAIPPDSFAGGYHGTDIPPEAVEANGGFPARGPVEDWRLREHAEEASKPVSAFRGSTPYPTSPDGETGASYWADKGGWVYQVSGVPTWGVNSDLEGRVKTGNGLYRGSLMSEAEGAFPAQTPLECVERWGRVGESSSGRLYVRDWVANPRYDPAACAKFWGRPL
jgi:hypothetical protein